MKFYFFYNVGAPLPFAGDTQALRILIDGLSKMGHEGFISNSIDDAASADHVFLCNVCVDLNPFYEIMHMLKRPYAVIPFHEDFLLYSATAGGFFGYVENALASKDDDCLEKLLETPEIVRYFPIAPKRHAMVNFDVIKNSTFCLANSPTEARTIKRDCPLAVPKVVLLTSGQVEKSDYPYSDSFLRLLGVEKGGYILQVGRMELRKNQLASILATRKLDIPLVFICTAVREIYMPYINACLNAIRRWRTRAPTYILSSDMDDLDDGNLHIRHIPGGLSNEQLVSAYQNAALNLHPAFYETPGYTYLESAKLGIPTVASNWGTIKDYFVDPKTGEYSLDERIRYCNPHRINEMEKLILLQLGRKFEPSTHPIFHRKSEDAARELLKLVTG